MFFLCAVSHSAVEICGALVLAVWVFTGRFLRETRSWLASPPALPVLGMLLLPWLGLLYTSSPADGLSVAARGYHWLYCIPLAAIMREKRAAEILVRLFLAGISLNSLFSLLQLAGAAPMKYGSPSGLLGISSPWITYSLLLTAAIYIASFFFRRAGSAGERSLYLFLMLLYFVTIGFVGGRSGYLAFILLSPLLVYNLIGGRHMARLLVLSAALVGVLFMFPVVQSRFAAIRSDLATFAQGDVNTSVGLRLHMWSVACNEIKEHPFTGLGTEGFRDAWELRKKGSRLPVFDHPHNSFLYVAVSYGLGGLAVFCWLIAVMLLQGIRASASPAGFSLLIFTLVFVIGSLTDTQLLVFPTMLLFILSAGVSGAGLPATEAA